MRTKPDEPPRPTESELAEQFAALGLPRDQEAGYRQPYRPVVVHGGDTAASLLQRFGKVCQQPPKSWAWWPIGFLPAVAFEEGS